MDTITRIMQGALGQYPFGMVPIIERATYSDSPSSETATPSLAREQLTHELKQQSYRKILSQKGIKKLKHNQNLFFENMVQV